MAFSEGPIWGREETRAQLRVILGFVLGAILIGLPLFLWRRPRVVPANDAVVQANPDAAASDGGLASLPVDAGATSASVVVGAARVLECHDRGNAKTAPADCDHPKAIEDALAAAIIASASCAHGEAGTIGYDVDVSFLRKRNPLEITAPRDDRTMKNAKTAKGCATEMKKAVLASVDPDGGTSHAALASGAHAHGRYRLMVTASYGSP